MTSPSSTPTEPVLERGPFFRILPAPWRDEPPRLRAGRRAAVLALAAWLPLLVLALAADGFTVAAETHSLLSDLGAWFRYLIAIPAFVFATPFCAQMLSAIVWHFDDAGLIDPSHRASFTALIARARSASESRLALAGIVIASYAVISTLFATVPSRELLTWQLTADGQHASAAGLWQYVISGPILMSLMLVWIWRWIVWCWLLSRIAREPLRLSATHPDRCAGLRFVGYSVRTFAPVGFAVGAVAAGRFGNEIVRHGHTVAELAPALTVTALVFVAFACLPTFAFTRNLLSEWREGVFGYGRIAGELERAFADKWVTRRGSIGAESLGAPDFSSSVDLSGYVSTVYDMRLTVVDLRSMVLLALATLVPAVPIVLATVPLAKLMGDVAAMLF